MNLDEFIRVAAFGVQTAMLVSAPVLLFGLVAGITADQQHGRDPCLGERDDQLVELRWSGCDDGQGRAGDKKSEQGGGVTHDGTPLLSPITTR